MLIENLNLINDLLPKNLMKNNFLKQINILSVK